MEKDCVRRKFTTEGHRSYRASRIDSTRRKLKVKKTIMHFTYTYYEPTYFSVESGPTVAVVLKQ